MSKIKAKYLCPKCGCLMRFTSTDTDGQSLFICGRDNCRTVWKPPTLADRFKANRDTGKKRGKR